MSVKLLELLFKGPNSELKLSHFTAKDGEPLNDEEDLLFVSELIDGVAAPDRKGRGREKWYLYNIVANKDCGLDVDRLDYLLRDSKCSMGLDGTFALDHILDNAAVRMAKREDDDEPYPVVAFARKAATELWKVFSARNEMFDKVYLHASAVGRELLLKDLLKALSDLGCQALPGKSLSEAAANAEDFVKLDDHIVTRLSLRLEDKLAAISPAELLLPKNAQLKKANDLLSRSRRHSHYSKLGEYLAPVDDSEAKRMKKDLEEQLDETANSHGGGALGSSDFSVNICNVNHGDKANNPMAKMTFFHAKEDDVDKLATPLDEAERWLPLPQHFERKTIRVYFKGEDSDAAKELVEKAWRAFEEAQPSASVGNDYHLNQGYSQSQ